MRQRAQTDGSFQLVDVLKKNRKMNPTDENNSALKINNVSTGCKKETICTPADSPPSDPPRIYKQYEDGFIVRSMTSADTRFSLNGFNEGSATGHDLELALEASSPNPVGYFVGELNGEVIASAIRIQVADGVFYGSMYFVAAEHRGKGFGRRTRDEVAVKVVGDNILAIDAHDELEAMNAKRGHVTSHKVTLYQGEADATAKEGRKNSKALINEASTLPFEEVLAYDDKCYIRPGSPWRRKFLRSLVDLLGGRAVVAVGENGVVGLGCRRPTLTDRHHIIGPLYADTPDIARDLVAGLTADCPGDKVLMSISETNEDAVEMVKSLGMTDMIHMIRMYLNGHPGNQSNKVFAITSIDVCGF